jgi:hypothetical protein
MYIETDGVHLKRHVMFIINDEDVHRKLMMYKTNREFGFMVNKIQVKKRDCPRSHGQ